MNTTTPSPAVVIAGACAVPFWGRTNAERLAVAFAKEGAPPSAPEAADELLVVRADAVLEPSVVRALLARGGAYALIGEEAEDGVLAVRLPAARRAEADALLKGAEVGMEVAADLGRFDAETLAGDYRHELRKRARPLARRLTADNRAALEWRVFQGTYKGVTDAITKYLWPWPAFLATRLCVRLGLAPNAVTLLGLGLTLAAFFLFRDGLWTAGLLAAWGMTFLDTVDGKLARVTSTSSRLGNILDHGIDLVHPPFWYVAWGLGLGVDDAALTESVLIPALAAIVAGYVLQRLIEGLFILFFGIEIHVWRHCDSAFRLITARRNPNLVLLTLFALGDRPDWGLLAVAAWTVASLAVHLVQLAQAGLAQRRGQAPVSWLSAPR